ncbi:MAG: hypothetical protein RLZZ30_1504 [Bacteroidota bacterium]|jgi:ABC-type bacteriocin/lantibiotic exporter with double-glycine peptidase domain
MTNLPTNLIQRFWLLLKPDQAEVRNLYLFSILSGILSLGLPLGIQLIISFIELGQLSVSWIVLVVLVVLSIGISGLLNIYQLRITENLQQRIFTRSAFEFAGRLPKIRLKELMQKYASDLVNRFFDTLTIQKGLSKLLIEFTAAVLQLVFCLVLLAFYHSFFIFMGLFLLILLALFVRLTARKGMLTSLDESSYKYKLAHWLQEISEARFSIKMSGSDDFHISKTDGYLNGYLNARDQHFQVLVKQYGFLILFKVFIALAFLILGGILVINQQMNIGQFVASEIIFLLIIGSVEKLILSIEVVYDVLTALEKIGQVTDLPLEQVNGEELQLSSESGLSISMDAVSFRMDMYPTPLLSNLTVTLPAHESVGIVADSSLTSNVLFCLMAGLYEATDGCVSFNKIPLQNLNKAKIRQQIGTVIAQDRLMSESVMENIRFGRSTIAIEAVEALITALDLSSFVHALPEKYASILKPEAHILPKEIEMKLLLARCCIGNPQLLLLEDPTAGLSVSQKQTLLDFLFTPTQKTVLIASHDQEVLQRCQRILVFHQGQLRFDGDYSSYLKVEKSC